MSEGNSERRETDPAKLAEQLEIELMLKRASWQHAKARRGNLRALSFAFVFLVVFGALLGFWYFLSSDKVQELKAAAAERAHASPSPTASPR
jgi:hypothetical protein